MKPIKRVVLCVGLLCGGVAAQAGLERYNQCDRPDLRRKLSSVPLQLGRWVGRDVEMDADILERTQADDWINRVYEDSNFPGRRLSLWINYSNTGLNMRHSPAVCLPGAGWELDEAATKVVEFKPQEGSPVNMTRLVYNQGELVQGIGFWYYIFGEGDIEKWVRTLPITNRSSHGRTTRGSGLTVEVFCPGQQDPNGESLKDFASALQTALEPLLPTDRVAYYVP